MTPLPERILRVMTTRTRSRLASTTILVGFLSTGAAAGQDPRVDALIRDGAVLEAVRQFDAIADQQRTYDPGQLNRLARAVLDEATRSDDPAAKAEACLTLLEVGPHDCEPTLTMTSRGPSPVVRLRLAVLRDPERAAALVDQLPAGDLPRMIDAVDALPPALAVRLLSRAVEQDEVELRYTALSRLATLDHPDALPVLRRWAARTDVPGHVIALAGLAAAGDEPATEAVLRELPSIGDADRLAVGVALATRKHPQGLPVIREMLSDPNELLQVDAAAALARLGDPVGRERLEADLRAQNVWVRLRALGHLRRLPTSPSPLLWRQMADSMPWVRVRAAQVLLAGGGTPDAGRAR